MSNIVGKVVVVGGGPAGCAAAWELGRGGADVVVLERGQPGRDKACGDALVPSAVRLLRRYGVDESFLAAHGGNPFHQIELVTENGVLGQMHFQGDQGWMIPRAVLDQALRDRVAARSRVIYGSTVTRVDSTDGPNLTVTVGHTPPAEHIRCDAVVLAAGSGNPLARQWGVSGDPTAAASIRAYAQCPAPDGLRFEFSDRDRPGYAWIFPQDSTSVNVGVFTLDTANVTHLRTRLSAFLALHDITSHNRWKGGGGSLWSGRGRTWHHGLGVVSCGDAAGVADPSSGEGMTAALLTGKMAGRAMLAFLQRDRDLMRLDEYSLWLCRHFIDRYGNSSERLIWNVLCGIQ